jgi:iron(III) transport system permease protein
MATVAVPEARVDVVRRKLSPLTVFGSLLLLLVGFLVLYPIIRVLIQSFDVSSPGQATRFGLDAWTTLLQEQGLKTAVWNTISLSAWREMFALPVAIFLAWLLARTNMPGRNWFEFAFWVSFFMPTLTVVLSWILLLDPEYGLINQALAMVGIPAFSIYSYWGIIWAHTIAHGISFKVMLFTPIFRNMNAAFEEASRVTGASALGTLGRIVLPIMLPAILAVEFLSFIRSLESFEIERILGTPMGFYVISTIIYDEVLQSEPRYGPAAALGVAALVIMMSLIWLQRRIVGNRRYTTVTGQYQSQVMHIGKWRWPATILMASVLALIVLVPLVFSIMGTFMKIFGFFTIADPWTLNNWQRALRDPLLLRSLQNTLLLAFGTAIVGVLVHSIIAYVIIRTRFFGRGALDLLSWLPYTIPGILLSLALLSMMLQPIFRPLYGSVFSLIIAGLVSGMPLAVQILKSNLMQLGGELEEASWVTGGNWVHTYFKVVLPLMASSLIVIALIKFIGAARNISQVALLSVSSNRPLSMLQLDYITEGKFEVASVLSCCVLILTLGVALAARAFGLRLGVGGEHRSQ